jgi:hypothetical protein
MKRYEAFAEELSKIAAMPRVSGRTVNRSAVMMKGVKGMTHRPDMRQLTVDSNIKPISVMHAGGGQVPPPPVRF